MLVDYRNFFEFVLVTFDDGLKTFGVSIARQLTVSPYQPVSLVVVPQFVHLKKVIVE